MANFSASQSISTIGLCQKIRSTDTSQYGNNDENIDSSAVIARRWIFTNSSNAVIKDYSTTNSSETFCECNISLLTFGITIQLIVTLVVRGDYGTSTGLNIPCLGI